MTGESRCRLARWRHNRPPNSGDLGALPKIGISMEVGATRNGLRNDGRLTAPRLTEGSDSGIGSRTERTNERKYWQVDLSTRRYHLMD